jgi:hypothetical protein
MNGEECGLVLFQDICHPKSSRGDRKRRYLLPETRINYLPDTSSVRQSCMNLTYDSSNWEVRYNMDGYFRFLRFSSGMLCRVVSYIVTHVLKKTAGFIFRVIFYLGDGRSRFLRNVGNHLPDDTTSHPKRLYVIFFQSQLIPLSLKYFYQHHYNLHRRYLSSRTALYTGN